MKNNQKAKTTTKKAAKRPPRTGTKSLTLGTQNEHRRAKGLRGKQLRQVIGIEAQQHELPPSLTRPPASKFLATPKPERPEHFPQKESLFGVSPNPTHPCRNAK